MEAYALLASLSEVPSLLASSSLLKLLLAVIVYSTALSFSDEIELMWMKKPSIPSVLYFLARYSAILFFSSAVVGVFLPQTAVCGS